MRLYNDIFRSAFEPSATRNIFYDENGRQVRTKKEIFDENGNVRKSCKIVKKVRKDAIDD